jgi:drug/metabolite transporter (DMT)-like permease
MPLSALGLVLGSAALHAVWNLLLARSSDVRAATTVTLGLSVVLFAPLAVLTWSVEAEAIPWIAASAALEIVYFYLLTTAYSRSDLSLVYPIARGAAPVLVLVGTTLAGVALGLWQAVGVVLVGAGVLLVRGLGAPVDTRGVLLALAVGGTIAGYTLVDKQGIEHASPIAYFELVLLPVAIAAVTVQLVRGRRANLRAEVSTATAMASICAFTAYALVLGALSLASAAAVAAVRETSILFAIALGAFVLREPVGRGRVTGAAFVVVGVALVAVG